MVRTPVDEAMIYEKRGADKKRAAMFARGNAKLSFLTQSVESYRTAGDFWEKEANNNSDYPRKAEHAMANAEHDRGLAEKMYEKMEGSKKSPGRYSPAVAGIAMISLLGALASISMNLTGNAIGNSLENNNWISIGLFFLGCVFTMFYFKLREKNVRKKRK